MICLTFYMFFTTMNQNYRGSVYAVLSGIFYGFLGYFGLSAIHGDVSASTMLFWRFLISSICIFIFMLPKVKKTQDSYKNMFIAFLTGLFYYGIATWCYFLASCYIGSGLAMVVYFCYPAIIILINYFMYKKAIPYVYYFALLLILIGMVLIVEQEKLALNLWGILFAVASAFFYACYIIASKKNQLSPNMSTLMVCLGCMMTSLLVSLLSHSLTLPTSALIWVHLFGISIIATVVPILFMLHSLKYISSEKASLLSVLEPVVVLILGVGLLNEKLQFWSAFGGFLVLIGALITLFSHKINVDLFKFRFIRGEEL